ncbi:Signal transduction histidine-protein kinase/phosphatase MprB [Actinomadura rubteroloni]|uniref:Signal transduction histidine-protein kinase/phosphatase MprB n=1 Tax=Actinomadura rubteroloni TaxID=1926885 RepID=A0A2P4UC48_9ACTN|nr:HAMP domain-containing sensor histidine kinase [Actinomadura rubteroloni]POM22602.1 Signal transduction histidine-protein kinase/phosphatase MprB [Actinomadura rubteroloni]
MSRAWRPLGRLPLRGRLALLIATAVAVAVAACATLSWFLVRDQLYRELDRRLGVLGGPPGRAGDPGRGARWAEDLTRLAAVCSPDPTESGSTFRFPGPYDIVQVVKADGTRCTVPDAGALTVTRADREVAAGRAAQAVHNGSGVTAGGAGTRVRVLTRPAVTLDGTRVALSYAIRLDQVNRPLNDLALMLSAVAAFGVLVSAGAGLMIARASLRPVDELTDAVEHIARTEDLGTPIPAHGADEIARLSRSFNLMTSALAASRERQRQLIADAGHELRTPLTSLRTNIDLLLRSEQTGRELPAGTRHRLLVSVKAQMVELSSLVGDLLELGRPDERGPEQAAVALHEVVGRAVERARLRGPGLRVDAAVEPWFVRGDPGSLERAVVNLLDNAVKFSPPGGTVRVRLAGGELVVADEGPGIPAADVPHVFERFWRSPSARSLPGSGLGLSIVARVARETGGRVAVDRADGGGALLRLSLPGGPAEPS